MQCPVCNKEMAEEDFGGVVVDICRFGCKGIWLDWMELDRLDENNEGLGSALEEALSNPRRNDQDRGKINCPKCDMPMYSHKFKKSKEVNVDECVNCGGFFLDSGELNTLRETGMSDEEHQEYLRGLSSEIPGYEQTLADIEKNKLRNRAVENYTRYMRFSFFRGR
jgi:Zn-finger nucleic acid-binding protein